MKQGLVDNQLSRNSEYDSLVGDVPSLEPFVGNEEPDEADMEFFYEMYSDYIEELSGKQKDNAIKMMKSAPDLYQGVSQAAFTILEAVKGRVEAREGAVPPAALFGEGAMIHTAVDEMFKLARAANIPGSEDQDQYTASQMDMQRLVGEYLQKAQEDDAIGEAQELMLDSEGIGATGNPEDVTGNERIQLEQAANQEIDTPMLEGEEIY